MLSLVNSWTTWLGQKLPKSRQAWIELLAGTLLLAGVVALAWWGRSLPLGLQLTGWALLLTALAVLSRRGWVKLFGPVLFYDMVRSARRGRHALLRFAYGLFLLAVLLTVYSIWFLLSGYSLKDIVTGGEMSSSSLADFAGSFFYVFMVIQFLAVFFLTPAYAAGAIAQEKESQTLDSLLATDLRSREIVLSKYASRLGNMAMVVLAGVPIQSALQFMGGVDPNLMVAGFVVLGLTMASLAGLSLLNSLYARKPRQAILRTYLMAFTYIILSGLTWLLLLPPGWALFPSTDTWTSPFTLEDGVAWINIGNAGSVVYELARDIRAGGRLDVLLPQVLIPYAWFHGLIAVGSCAWAILKLRAVSLAHGPPAGKSSKRGAGFPRPGVMRWPVLWKEVFVEAARRSGIFRRLGIGVLLAIGFFPVIHFMYFFDSVAIPLENDHFGRLMNYWARVISAFVGCVMLLQVAVRAAGSISGERDRKTFEGLMATPLSNRGIIISKWLGSICGPRWLGLCLALFWLVACLTGGMHWLAPVFFAGAWLVYAAFLSGLGLWFSIASRSTHRAIFWTLFAAAAILFVSFLGPFDLADRWLTPWEAFSMEPPATLAWLVFSPAEFDDWLLGRLRVPGWMAPSGHGSYDVLPFQTWQLGTGIAFWALAAAIVFLLVNIRFRIVTGRGALRRPPRLPPGTSPTPTLPHRWGEGGQEGVPTPVAVPSPGTPSLPPLRRGGQGGITMPPEVKNGAPSRAVLIVASSASLKGFSATGVTPAKVSKRRALRQAPRIARHFLPMFLPLFLLLGAFFYFKIDGDRKLQDALAETEALDPGWRLKELEAKRKKIPANRNGGLLVIKVKSLIPFPWEAENKLFDKKTDLLDIPHQRQFNGEQVQALTAILEEAEGALLIARRLVDFPEGRFPIDYNPYGLSSLLVHTQNARSAANLLGYDIKLRAQEGDLDGALASCRALLNVSRAIGDEPTLTSQLVRIAIRAIAINNIERVLAQGQATEPALHALQRLLEDEENQPLMLIGLRGERAMTDRHLQHLQEGHSKTYYWSGNDPLKELLPILVSGSINSQRADLLRLNNEAVEIAKLPTEQRSGPYNQMMKNWIKQQGLLARMFPAYFKLDEAHRRNQAVVRCALVAVALERYRLKHSNWPASLAVLVREGFLTAVPIDPYDGMLLRYRFVKDGVVIYTVGMDLTDNGGNIDRKNPMARGTDVGLQLWNVNRRRQWPPLFDPLIGVR